MESQETKSKDCFIQIRIDSETKAAFMNACDKKAVNSSKLIRQLIVAWTKENS